MPAIREPAVAGLFYPADPLRLAAGVRALLAAAPARTARPRALVVPHAGYVYSGGVAASAYALLRPHAAALRRVVLLGPAHRVALRGLALPRCEVFATPLGPVAIDGEMCARLDAPGPVSRSDAAHAREHSLEVQLPFLQEVLGEFLLVPLVVGEASADEVAHVIAEVADEPGTLLVVSTDLSHYHDYATACALDRATCAAIEALDWRALTPQRACGAVALAGLLQFAAARGLRAHRVGLCNSGDTAAGDRERVVGYGAWYFD